ncbi:DNA repair protein RecO [Gordonibacter massiliensis (ex Traore et al. 2017)]|uniref:DNA repair protein RecO n=1 Tax=Gordonibacter massiliensis (ex Traore et al. 2017) TaxID=1841863 RepID=UPI001C8B150F|nr:DNA repair protein RecO [Gordonibacter massiliensis (ex Traore et al. 2017)]
MASATYTARAIVLRKTKLGESDLIVTLLAEDGSQLRAVAKGARKPSSSFAARLELYSVVDVLCSKGRSLDLVKEARIAASHERLRRDLEHAACAAPMAELLDRVTQAGLESPRLFALTAAALDWLDGAETAQAPAFCAAHLLKALAFSGLRPSLEACVGCGADVADSPPGGSTFVSFREGGVVCPACRPSMEVVAVPAGTVGWCRVLMGSTFAEIEALNVEPSASFSVLRFCQQWVREHVGSKLKSLDFLFTSGLF